MISQGNLEAMYPGKYVSITENTIHIFDPETAEETTESFDVLTQRIRQEENIPDHLEFHP